MKKNKINRLTEIKIGLLLFSLLTIACFVAAYYYPTNGYIILGGIIVCLLLLTFLIFPLHSTHITKSHPAYQSMQSEITYRSLIENAGIVVYTADINGTILFANNQAADLTGYTPEELLGRDFSFLPHPAWMQQVFNFYTNQFQKKIPATTFEFLIRAKSGQQKWVEQSAQLLFEGDLVIGFQCMVKDITTKKKTEIELKESEAKRKENQYRLEAIIDHATSLIFIKDLDGRYIMVNKKFKELLGVTDQMVIGKTDHDFNPGPLADHYRQLDDKVKKSLQSIESEELIDGPEGKLNLLLMKFPLLDNEKNIFGIGGIATDITDRTHYQQQLISARKNAEQAKQMQENFLANMSREISTPMNGIEGMTNLLLETGLNDRQKEYTGNIQRSVNNLLVLVNDILDFSMIRSGKITPEKTAFNVQRVLDEVKKLLMHRMEKKGLVLQTQIDINVPSVLIGDPQRLSQVLVNIVGNAIKFTERGQIRIHISVQQKTKNAAFVQFAVSDTGIGIPADKLESIFESFAQADGNIIRRYGGAGLGLAISKSLLELQGGDISVKSKPGEGSVFTFYLPYGIKVKSNHISEQVDMSVLFKDKQFLVVEDNEVNQKFLSMVLKKVGAVVDIAANGKQAINYFNDGNKYDLVIMDIQMPIMDGYETAIYIRQVLKLDLPILAMTATTVKSELEKCIESGMNDCMRKPFEFEEMYKRLVRLLYKHTNLQDQQEDADYDKQLYSLELFDSLDDKESLLQVLKIFLDDAPAQIRELCDLATQQNWNELSRSAHKLKGAIAMLRADEITDLLSKIESSSKDEKDRTAVPSLVIQVSDLFSQLEEQLRDEAQVIEDQINSGDNGKQKTLL